MLQHPWPHCRDPVEAYLLTAQRLGWKVVDIKTVIDDLGVHRGLSRVSPSFFSQLAVRATARWSDREATAKHWSRGFELNWTALEPLLHQTSTTWPWSSRSRGLPMDHRLSISRGV